MIFAFLLITRVPFANLHREDDKKFACLADSKYIILLKSAKNKNKELKVNAVIRGGRGF